MSKYVKNLIAEHLRQRLASVDNALLVNVVGLDANASNQLRSQLRSRDINLMVVKNSLAAMATSNTPLAAMFEGLAGTSAICWGAEDIVSLTKEVTRLADQSEFEAFEARGGVMEGECLSAAEVAAVSKWPTREEQLSILVGQILGPASQLAAQLNGPGGALVSQVQQHSEGEAESSEA